MGKKKWTPPGERRSHHQRKGGHQKRPFSNKRVGQRESFNPRQKNTETERPMYVCNALTIHLIFDIYHTCNPVNISDLWRGCWRKMWASHSLLDRQMVSRAWSRRDSPISRWTRLTVMETRCGLPTFWHRYHQELVRLLIYPRCKLNYLCELNYSLSIDSRYSFVFNLIYNLQSKISINRIFL